MFLEIRNIVRRPYRTVLTLFGIGVGTAAYITFVAVGSGLLEEFQDTVSMLGSDLAVQQGTAASVWVSRIESQDLQVLRALPDVAGVTEVVVSSTRFLGQKYFIVFGLDPDGSLFDRCRLHSGRWFTANRREMMIGHRAARAIGLEAGDRIEARGRRFLISGVYETGRSLLDGAAIMDLDAARRMFKYGDAVNLAFVDVGDSRKIDEVIARIEADLPHLAVDRSDMWVSTYEQYMVVKRFTRSLALLALLVTAFWVSNTLHVTFNERRHELAILRAIGWRTRRIASSVLVETLILSVGGGFLGIILAWGVVHLLVGMEGVTVYATRLAPAALFEGFCVAVVAGIVGAVVPLGKVLRIRAAEALRAL